MRTIDVVLVVGSMMVLLATAVWVFASLQRQRRETGGRVVSGVWVIVPPALVVMSGMLAVLILPTITH